MAPVTEEAIKNIGKFLELVKGTGMEITRAVLFGSYAKGTADRWSDMDVALVSPDFSGVPFYDRKALIPMIIKSDIRIEIHPFKPEDFTSEDCFVVEILKNGVVLV